MSTPGVSTAPSATARRRRTRRRAALLAALAFALAGALPAAAAGGAPIALNAQPWPPYYLDDAKKPGFARELLQLCIGEMGYETRFSPLPIDAMYKALRNGVLDGHVFSPDKSRESFVVYGKAPLFSDAYRPVVRAGSGIQIRGVGDFDKLRLAHLRGLRYTDAYHDYVLKRLAAGTVVEADSNEELLDLLLANKVDVFVNLASTTRWLAGLRKETDRVTILPYDVKRSDYYLAVALKSKHITDHAAFLSAFDACVERTRKDGRYDRLRARYGME